ncbi:hypothetical protein EDD86DRAFT_211580, partial [Gorgonomyces haynaldii]
MQSLPFHLLQKIASHLFFKDYCNLRLVCKRLSLLPQTPLLSFDEFSISVLFLGPQSDRIDLLLDGLDDEQFLFLVENDLKRQMVRVLECKKPVSLECLQVLFDRCTLQMDRQMMLRLLKASPDLQIDPSVLSYFCAEGDTEMVRQIMQSVWVDPSADGDHALQEAVYFGHLDTVQVLLEDPRVDPTLEDNHCLREACISGNLEMVKLFLADPRVDPTAHKSVCLDLAMEYGHEEIVDLLLAYSKGSWAQ